MRISADELWITLNYLECKGEKRLFYRDYLKLMEEKGIEVGSRKNVEKVLSHFPFKISSHYLSLVNWDNPNCPIKHQTFPSVGELGFRTHLLDVCHEEEILKHDCLLHRYKDRVLLMVSNQCFTYYRFCTRKWFLGRGRMNISMSKIIRALNYIRKHKEITEVIISGGDPLVF